MKFEIEYFATEIDEIADNGGIEIIKDTVDDFNDFYELLENYSQYNIINIKRLDATPCLFYY